jgi:putative transposase
VENGFMESFNGKRRDECLNTHHFVTLAEARQVIEQWRVEYHTERPHRGLHQQTPEEYAESWTPEAGSASPTPSDRAVA